MGRSRCTHFSLLVFSQPVTLRKGFLIQHTEELWDGEVAGGFQRHGGGYHANAAGNVTPLLSATRSASKLTRLVGHVEHREGICFHSSSSKSLHAQGNRLKKGRRIPFRLDLVQRDLGVWLGRRYGNIGRRCLPPFVAVPACSSCRRFERGR